MDTNETVIPRSTLQKEINELKKMSSRGLFKKLLKSEVDKGTIAQCFKRIDEATKTVLVCIYVPSGSTPTDPSHPA